MANDRTQDIRSQDRPTSSPGEEEDGINRLKAIERAGQEHWVSDAAGGYTDEDGNHRDAYGDPDRDNCRAAG